MLSRLTLSVLLALAASASADDGFVHHPDIGISLFAKEPMVVDPVALAFAANGDLFVVEMRDYPYGFGSDRKPGGTVRLLRDTDGDGKADHSALFAEDLSFPTSVAPWRGGILVAAPPQILYLEDTDGDDKADVRKVILDGFILGVTDGNLSGLQWGIDGRIHGTKGASAAFVHSPLHDDPPLRLGGYDFAFDPDTGKIERTGLSSAGFGIVFDPFGRCFSNYNIDYLQQHIVPFRYTWGKDWLPDKRTTTHISVHGPDARIFPVSEPETRLNHPEQAGRFSSASGMGYIDSGVFSERLNHSILICDVVCNLVHRNLLVEDGPVFKGMRAPEEQQSEFIASRDNAFRPVSLAWGPDQSVYLADMHRDVIEHPDYIPKKTQEGLNIRGGDDRGRIYRIFSKTRQPAELPHDLQSRPDTALTELLSSDSPWHRETAQRLLLHRNAAPSGGDSLPPHAQVRLLWTLHRLGRLSRDQLAAVLKSLIPDVRENALQIAEKDSALAGAIEKCLSDPHPRVRFQAALSYSKTENRNARILRTMLTIDGTDPWLRFAILTASGGIAPDMLRDLATLGNQPQDLLRELAECAAAQDSDLDVSLLPLNTAILQGLAAGWKKSPPKNPAALAEGLSRWCASADTGGDVSALVGIHRQLGLTIPESLDPAIKNAFDTARDSSIPFDQRQAAIQLIGQLPRKASLETLYALLDGKEPAPVQQSALNSIKSLARPESGKEIVNRWAELSPFARQDAIRLLLSREEWQHALLAGMETGTLHQRDLNLDLEQRRTLLRWSSPSVRKRAKEQIADEEYQNRNDVALRLLAELPDSYDSGDGRETFAALCSTCHQAGGTGIAVGPDLGSISHRSVEDILSHIVDPNMAINPKYATCSVQTNDGRQFTGILASEDADGIRLLMPAGIHKNIPRSGIKSFRTLQTSLMPEGLEAAMTPQQMRNLIAFLRGK